MKSYIIYYSCLTIFCKTKSILDTITQVMVKMYPEDGGVYLACMLFQGSKQDDLNSDAPGFLTQMVNKKLDPKIPVMLVFSIELKNKNIYMIGLIC